MPTLTQEQLEKILKDYSGKLLVNEQLSAYQQFSLPLFSNPKSVSDPRVQVTFQLDITAIYLNFEKNYKQSPEATFTAFIKWILIKAMYETPFYWRYINGQWYEFKNLPLEVSVALSDERQQALYFLNNVIHDPWETFFQKHHAIASGELPDALQLIKVLPLHTLAIEIVGVHFPRMTSYSTTNKVENIHQPWIVFSDKYLQGDSLHLPLYFSFSHSSLTPNLVENFLKKFCLFAKHPPEQVDAIYKYMNGKNTQEKKSLFFREPAIIPRSQKINTQGKIVTTSPRKEEEVKKLTKEEEVKKITKAKL